ncbi:MAG: DNA polymerase III subunit delta' [Candidatus Muproteobacteria bacterium RIFCSPLOWO2_01_FULL_60_18]|uniref:DNA polymerase III subunit delta' n=1 Tax=Candidatus Muproteobacteria bacterium RIFCSPLOWO2_01_FULL_60_18 TaxID=1817768 RepID=A0A1F6TYH0_9PROT|nr:MAG: DNA polymerase III subunit delta' [Candidatus Muproteobacteria bacterium RIFCSPLOWO2_01_FULL_60_18]
MAGDRNTALNFSVAPERYPWHGALWSALSRQFDQLPHALLLQGRPGLGKHAFAVQLAQALLCEQPRAGVACGKCHGCHLFSVGTHPDLSGVGLVDDAKSITVDQIRALGDFLSLRPHTATRKVVIISPADAMNINAANSLLKLLEEPPLGSMLLLVTSHPARLPATIRSRCARLLFRLPTPSVGQAWLQTRPETRNQPAQLLDLAGGAPLLAEILAHEEFPQMRAKLLQDLAGLSQGREHPVTCAARWKSLGTARALGWLHGFVSDQIRIRMGAPASALLNPEVAARGAQENNKYKINELYGFIDVILENYRQINSPLDELLMLEDVLIRWVRLSRLQ